MSVGTYKVKKLFRSYVWMTRARYARRVSSIKSSQYSLLDCENPTIVENWGNSYQTSIGRGQWTSTTENRPIDLSGWLYSFHVRSLHLYTFDLSNRLLHPLLPLSPFFHRRFKAQEMKLLRVALNSIEDMLALTSHTILEFQNTSDLDWNSRLWICSKVSV